ADLEQIGVFGNVEHGLSLNSSKAETPFPEGVERSPDQPVEKRHQYAHDGNAEHDPRKIAGLRRKRYIGAESLRRQVGIAPARDLRNDGCVPRSSRGSDRAGDVIGENAGQYGLDPPAPALEMETAGGLTHVGRKCTGARDDVEEDIPLRAQDHQRAEPDVGIEAVA